MFTRVFVEFQKSSKAEAVSCKELCITSPLKLSLKLQVLFKDVVKLMEAAWWGSNATHVAAGPAATTLSPGAAQAPSVGLSSSRRSIGEY